jgi:hypothetical protein
MCDQSDGVRREESGPNVGDEDEPFFETVEPIGKEMVPGGTAKMRGKGGELVHAEDGDDDLDAVVPW